MHGIFSGEGKSCCRYISLNLCTFFFSFFLQFSHRCKFRHVFRINTFAFPPPLSSPETKSYTRRWRFVANTFFFFFFQSGRRRFVNLRQQYGSVYVISFSDSIIFRKPINTQRRGILKKTIRKTSNWKIILG